MTWSHPEVGVSACSTLGATEAAQHHGDAGTAEGWFRDGLLGHLSHRGIDWPFIRFHNPARQEVDDVAVGADREDVVVFACDPRRYIDPAGHDLQSVRRSGSLVPEHNPAALAEPNLEWAVLGRKSLAQVQAAMHGLAGAESAKFDHIGSTSVPGLAAKPFLDLQVRILPLPSHEDLLVRLAPLGFRRARGARPDSPGVSRDMPRGDEEVPDDVWEKRLYVDQGQSRILHIRRADSPWGRHAVWFRDWLRTHPDARLRYEATKRVLSEENVGKKDYDDYTRAKSAFFDEVHSDFVTWARETGRAR